MDGRLHKHLLDGEKAPPDQLKAISLKVVIRTQTNSLPHARRVKSVRFIISLKLVRTQNSQFSNEITHLSNEIALFQMKSSLPRRAMRGCDASPRPSSIARGARLSRERREDAGGGARQEQTWRQRDRQRGGAVRSSGRDAETRTRGRRRRRDSRGRRRRGAATRACACVGAVAVGCSGRRES